MKITKITDPAVTVIFNESLVKGYKVILAVAAHLLNQGFEGVLNSSVYKFIPTGNELGLEPGDIYFRTLHLRVLL
jgi:hypothetical protein